MKLPFGRLITAAAIAVGVASGVGAYTFHYGEGLSYFSTDPKNCANCHIMNDQYDSWQKGPHHHVAKCVDCHLPHEGIDKLLAKADNGYRHSAAFTLQNFHEPIQFTPRNARILQEACVRCHGEVVHNLVAGATTASDAVQCVHCHANVGHGPVR